MKVQVRASKAPCIEEKLVTFVSPKRGKGGDSDVSKASNRYRPFGRAQGGRQSTDRIQQARGRSEERNCHEQRGVSANGSSRVYFGRRRRVDYAALQFGGGGPHST